MPRLSKIGAAALASFGFSSTTDSVTASYLQVAGGGGGSYDRGGGGGAGGLLTGTTSLSLASSYTVTIGAGGVGATTNANGSNGSNSQFGTLTASVGGGGGASYLTAGGSTGGSGGGGSYTNTGGAGTSAQGNAGGNGESSVYVNGGGGGGANTAGQTPSSSGSGGNGGAGANSSISGTSTTYAGGGGGGHDTRAGGSAGSGGIGGGGAGGLTGAGTAGTANLGGGGGGGGNNGGSSPQVGGAGGSGIVIISYLGIQKFGGGVVTSVGGNTIHTFNTSGTLVPLSSLTASYLIVAGGAGGGSLGGGGGAGGLLSGAGVTIDTNSTYAITVGSGGTGGTGGNIGTNGANSSFSVVPTTAIGGGAGAPYDTTSGGSSGGSGGGAGVNSATNTRTGGAGTSGQGNDGGSHISLANYSGGGGGAGAVGGNASAGVSGSGGAGTTSSISGTSTTYAGGGGGGTFNVGTAGAGGTGGGGAGSTNTNATSGTANLGGGGGGGGWTGGGYGNGGSGGSGIVIISYAGVTQQMAGGTVTISGGNVIHTFTSSGYLAPLKLVNNSLRFRSSASAYMTWLPTAAGNRKTWTLSFWMKAGDLATDNQTMFSTSQASDRIGFQTSTSSREMVIILGASSANIATSQVFRDPAAWYHIVYSIDTTQATAADRIKVYVNGNQVTSFVTSTYPTLNYDTGFGTSAYTQAIGRRQSTSNLYFDGYLTEINFIDGQALTPNSFGTFNSYGVWQPITYGGSYGTNGFYLPFTNKTSTTTLGYDFSPNGNNWTPNNLSLTAGNTYDSMTDVPTLTSANTANYCVLNPLSALNSSTIADGNLKGTLSAATALTDIYGTMASGTTGKFYWETTYVSRSGNSALTIGGVKSDVFGAEPSGTGGFGYYSVGGQVFVNGSTVATYATYATSDVIGVALDLTNSQVSFYKQTSGTGSFVLQGTVSIASGYSWIPGYSNGTTSGNQVFTVNFGQQPFNNSSPPSGYVALNTYNI